jgi:hypothetical protein
MTSPHRAEGAVANGGPLDGTRLGDAGADEFQAVMADGTTHRYLRTQARTMAGVIYDHAGRV